MRRHSKAMTAPQVNLLADALKPSARDARADAGRGGRVANADAVSQFERLQNIAKHMIWKRFFSLPRGLGRDQQLAFGVQIHEPRLSCVCYDQQR